MTQRHPTLLLMLIYAAAHLPVFIIHDALYWDDWHMVLQSHNTLLREFSQAGHPWAGHLHLFLLGMGKTSYTILSFLAYGVVPLTVFSLLRLSGAEQSRAFWIAAFMAVLPLNAARVAGINIFYALCYALFFTGWWLLIRSTVKHKPVLQWLVLPCFFLSFITQSLLVFFALPMLHVLAMQWRTHHHRILILNHLHLLILPIVFFVVKNAYFFPYGAFESYQGLRLNPMLHGWLTFLMITDMADFSTHAATVMCLLVAVSMCALLWCSRSLMREGFQWLRNQNVAMPLELFGLLALLLGIFPYFAIGRFPTFLDWEDRYQLLMPLGLALIFTGLAFRLLQEKACNLLMIVTVLCIITWQKTYLDFYVDWVKQLAIVETLKKEKHLERSTDLLWVDQTKGLNANRREYRAYEFAGWFHEAYGTKKHFVLPYEKFRRESLSWADHRKAHAPALRRTHPTQPQLLLVTLQYNTDAGNHLRYGLKMLIKQWFYPEKFQSSLESLLMLDVPV